MPYKAVKAGKGYVVMTVAGPHKGHRHDNHPISREQAQRQIRAIGMNTHKKGR